MKKRQLFEVNIYYPAELYFNEGDAKVKKVLGYRGQADTGMGFGSRDMHLFAKTVKARDQLIKRAQSKKAEILGIVYEGWQTLDPADWDL